MQRHRYASVLSAAAVVLFASACGSNSGGNASANNAGAAPQQAQPTASSAMADDGAQTGGAGGALPVNSMAEEAGGGANDGNDAKVPQGMSEAKAVAAGMGKDGKTVVSVTGTETTCVPDKTTIKAGEVWFKITNQGTRITEMYLESPDAEELVEIEKIKKGASGAFKTTVKPGSYLVACEPGMADKQVRTGITVTG